MGLDKIKGWDYWDTYALAATWGSIHLIPAMAIIQGWHSKQIDFVMANTQAEVKHDRYMEIPKSFQFYVPGDYVLEIHKNIYGQKQVGRVCNQYLVSKLKLLGLHQPV